MKIRRTNYLKLFIFLLALKVPCLAIAEPVFAPFAIDCGAEFPCPEELKPRVSFWMDVFSKYSKNEAIFHDPEEPSRIYSVIQTESNCPRSGKEPADIKAERGRIEQLLMQMRDGGDADDYFRNMFPSNVSKNEITEAADRIRCQKGVKEDFVEGLKRYAKYKTIVVDALKTEGLHEDYQFLPFVESSYNPQVFSFVGAAGMWQLMPKTARLNGLIVTYGVDQRLDPYESTRIAARFIKNTLEKNMNNIVSEVTTISLAPLILTSYNFGPAGMAKAVRKVGPDYLEIMSSYKGRNFGVAVKNFYPSFLAAREVAKHASEYIGQVDAYALPKFDEVTLPAASSPGRVAKTFDVKLEDLEPLNPAIREFVWENVGQVIPKGYKLRVPKADKNWTELAAVLTTLPPETTTHVVRSGDNLSNIAKQYRVSINAIQSANQLNGAFIRPGQKLVIPGTPS